MKFKIYFLCKRAQELEFHNELSAKEQRREFSKNQSFSWKRKDCIVPVELGLSAGEHKRFYSRLDTLVNRITVNSE